MDEEPETPEARLERMRAAYIALLAERAAAIAQQIATQLPAKPVDDSAR